MIRRILLTMAAVMVLSCTGKNCPVDELKDFPSAYLVCPDARDSIPNTWVAWRQDLQLDKVPKEAIFRISCDSKYWLWVNGELVVFEGCLKRGPDAVDSYYDELDLAPWLKEGANSLAILQWYFGRSGFSHNDSGKAVMWVSSKFVDPDGWLCRIHPAFGDTDAPLPNYRLPESNIRFVEARNIPGWQTAPAGEGFVPARSLDGKPLGGLRPRPIPQWKDYGLKPAEWTVKPGEQCDTMYADLPYNMQMTPMITVSDSEGGHLVRIETDHAYHGGALCLRAEYVTAPGTHSYESPGWLNGEHLLIIAPHGVRLDSLAYRETGYDTDFSGEFSCDDDFYMRFWKKAQRTLYVNMRDNFFDCPDRERAQWWGDIVTLQGEAFYTCSRSVDALVEKGIRQLCEYQREDSTIFSPIPGNYTKELPAQMLSSVGRYGFWTYYLNTGDISTLRFVYPCVKRYLGVWKLDESGLTAFRTGGWSWGDWGRDIDIRLVLAAWHYMALDGAAMMADELGLKEDAEAYRSVMVKVRDAYNACWNGSAYRHPDYDKATDDRVQALAVVAGIAPEAWWPQITETLKKEEHASPYLEKYVMEALFLMGEGELAMDRERRRFGEMVNDPLHSTLYEGWSIGSNDFGGGTTNHAWSGGALTVIAQELCGVRPLAPGWKLFEIAPKPVCFGECSISVPTVKGEVSSSWKSDGSQWTVVIPKGTRARIVDPWSGRTFEKGPGRWELSGGIRQK